MLRLPDAFLDQLQAEDTPHGDLTTIALAIGERPGRMRFSARAPQVVCCVEEAVRLIERAGAQVSAYCRSGDFLPSGALILEATGPAEALLLSWKVAQTLIEATSGISTAVRHLVEAAERGGGAVVACTRKTFPGAKAASLKAVYAGGGVPHRLGLSDSLLVFPEHRVFLGADTADALRHLKAACPEKKVVAEVINVDEALQMARIGIDVLQLEKFPPEAVAETVRALSDLPSPPVLAAAGGVNAGNAEAYVRAGAKILVSSSPYWAKPADVSVKITADGPGHAGHAIPS
ncbi:ModD protein [Telmatospirillum siberiense]|uniref:Putative pyrophosphorylase ModD n=1 Tax=Telmatospirillum siberiense TaxID=382514 RepID=A0A2N3PR18_9PROT|nr:ModD protein [Telmatospirillum siberiense]PKU22841.1 ModD protein [Telmatospirillum siberiense]